MNDESNSERPCSRQQVLCQFAGAALALAVLPRCGATLPPAEAAAGAAPGCDDSRRSEADDWVPVPLADYPPLADEGGSAVIQLPDKLLDVVAVHVSQGCFRAVWRICTHGACEVEFQPDLNGVECPCHGSRFSLEGTVLRGPATRALAAFPAVRDGDQLWIRRWS